MTKPTAAEQQLINDGVMIYCGECGWSGPKESLERLVLETPEMDAEFFEEVLDENDPKRPTCCPGCGSLTEEDH